MNLDTKGNWTGNWKDPIKVARRTGRGYGNPAWHPINPVIAYEDLADAADDTDDIFLVNDDGTSVGSPVNLTNTPGTDERKLSWSSDGSQFAAEVWHPDISDVVVYNFNSDNNPPITRVTSLVRLNDVTAQQRS